MRTERPTAEALPPNATSLLPPPLGRWYAPLNPRPEYAMLAIDAALDGLQQAISLLDNGEKEQLGTALTELVDSIETERNRLVDLHRTIERVLGGDMDILAVPPDDDGTVAGLARAINRLIEAFRTHTDTVFGHVDQLAQTGESASVLDTGRMAALRALEKVTGDPLVADLVTSFRSSVPTRLSQMRSALESGGFDAVEFGAHRIKAQATNIGATDVSSVAQLVEDAAVRGDEGELPKLLEALKRSFAAIEDKLEG